MLGLAQTGVGKTAAFCLPVIERLSRGEGGGIRALILAPTRELALQIDAEFCTLAQFTSLRTCCVFGGTDSAPQIEELGRHPDVLVACPGRLLDLVKRGQAGLKRVEILVLDEVDQMLDMGFLPDVLSLLEALPERRQNLFFSATLPDEIRRLVKRVQQRPKVIELEHARAPEIIEHALYPVFQQHKMDLAQHLLKERSYDSAIVFLRTQHRAKRLAQVLARAGFNCVALQGGMSQKQRTEAMEGFRRGDHKILVATDIAARGIDVTRVSLVLNFDMPTTVELYTHRIGRTGRGKRRGEACTLMTEEDFAMVRRIEAQVGSRIPRRVAMGFDMDRFSAREAEAARAWPEESQASGPAEGRREPPLRAGGSAASSGKQPGQQRRFVGPASPRAASQETGRGGGRRGRGARRRRS